MRFINRNYFLKWKGTQWRVDWFSNKMTHFQRTHDIMNPSTVVYYTRHDLIWNAIHEQKHNQKESNPRRGSLDKISPCLLLMQKGFSIHITNHTTNDTHQSHTNTHNNTHHIHTSLQIKKIHPNLPPKATQGAFVWQTLEFKKWPTWLLHCSIKRDYIRMKRVWSNDYECSWIVWLSWGFFLYSK